MFSLLQYGMFRKISYDGVVDILNQLIIFKLTCSEVLVYSELENSSTINLRTDIVFLMNPN